MGPPPAYLPCAMRPERYSRAFAGYAWAFLAYLVFVILFGAWVRITHSGAGCGAHWPTCNGEVIPFDPSIETLIEYTHRLTSGLLGLLGILLVAWAARSFGRHRVTFAAAVTLLFIVFEALIGAGLVLEELVGSDASVARAVVIALHLANTLVLTAAATLTAWWAGHPQRSAVGEAGSVPRWLLVAALLATVVTAMTGAVTALGDTLFPVDPAAGGGLLARLREGLSPAEHFLVRLRIVHPVVALATGGLLVRLALRLWHSPEAARPARWLLVLTVLEVLAGFVNIYLAAPGWMQILHLLLAQLLWAALVVSTDVARTASPVAVHRSAASATSPA
ncbi:MAG: heme A synthase [Deltaproteobacteria bacterium]|nr:MAG: heme A synthase [Deltaproteobacteria bacterium]